MATELTNYFNDKLSNYEHLIFSATTGFSDAVTELNDADEDHGNAVDALAELDHDISKLRADAAGANLTPADIEDLAERLREKLIKRRKQYAELLTLNERVFNARLLKANYAELLARYETLASDCSRQAADDKARSVLHTDWYSTETDDTVDADKTTAAILLAEVSDTPDPPADPNSEIGAQRALIAAAKARIEADIPEVLRTRSRTRTSALAEDYTDQIRDQMRHVEDASAVYRAANEGDSGALAQSWLAYERAETDLRDAATRSGAKLNRALSLLQSANDATALTTAERDQIADAALAEDALDLTTEADRDTAAAAVVAKRLDLELAIVNAVLADPTADPDDDAAVQTCQGELATLEATLATKAAEHTAAFALAIDTWEVAVPNHVWRALADYDAAVATLEELVATDLTAQRDALTGAETQLGEETPPGAETQLVAALGKDEANKQALLFADAAVAAARKRMQFIKQEHGARRLSAVRGDA